MLILASLDSSIFHDPIIKVDILWLFVGSIMLAGNLKTSSEQASYIVIESCIPEQHVVASIQASSYRTSYLHFIVDAPNIDDLSVTLIDQAILEIFHQSLCHLWTPYRHV